MKKRHTIGITGWGSCSALGHQKEEIWQQYAHPKTAIRQSSPSGQYTAALPPQTANSLQHLVRKHKAYRRLDHAVLMAMLAAEQAVLDSGWDSASDLGLYLGSSRGATSSWEHYYQQFRTQSGQLPPQSSPLTTAGNMATHTAQHLGINGFVSDHSITCSSAVHAIANAMVWLESGRYQRFLAGGSEAPLTPFTMAQMAALKIYAPNVEDSYPNRSLDLEKTNNTMVLGEGSAVFGLESNAKNPLAIIAGLGYARENIDSLTAVSRTGLALQQAMRQALKEAALETVDIVVCHSPGTLQGDQSEWNAIQAVFDKKKPSLTSNKWKLGHTLGASGGLSLELALLMLTHQTFVPIPYLKNTGEPANIRHIMINALGFGGNAISLIIKRP